MPGPDRYPSMPGPDRYIKVPGRRASDTGHLAKCPVSPAPEMRTESRCAQGEWGVKIPKNAFHSYSCTCSMSHRSRERARERATDNRAALSGECSSMRRWTDAVADRIADTPAGPAAALFIVDGRRLVV